MPRRPTGVYVRQTPDWFTAKRGIGGLIRWSKVNMAASVGLYNDSASGEILHIDRIWYWNNGVGPIYVTREKGAQGTQVGGCFQIPTLGTPVPGQLYYRDLPGLASSPFPVDTVQLSYMAGGDSSAQQNSFEPPGPLCALFAGYGLWLQQFFNNGPT